MRIRKSYYFVAGLLIAFALWTVALCVVDIGEIGPQGSRVGFATLNRWVHDAIGVHMLLYTITDWLGLVPIGLMCGFATLGLVQWLRRKALCRVDFDLLALGGFYLAVIAIYVFFELCVINYRPVLINGYLEASYPSSTTMLVMCIMPTAALQLHTRLKNLRLRQGILLAMAAFTLFMIIGRLVSGVHWVTDIIGGALLSAGLVLLYRSIVTEKATNR